MRFVWAVLAFVLATLLVGAGIAQRTVFLGPSSEQIELTTADQPAAYTLIDGEVLRVHEGTQTLLVRGEGEIFVAYGRSDDLHAWLSDVAHTVVSVGDTGEFEVTAVAAQVVSPSQPEQAPDEEEQAEEQPGDEEMTEEEQSEASASEDAEESTEAAADQTPETAAAGRSPSGSDLWLDEYTDRGTVSLPLHLPEGVSVLIARDGTEPAPSEILVSWPLDNSTPWVGPLIVAGFLVMLLGVMLYAHALRIQRRGKGPRRKGPGPLPPTEPISKVLDTAPVRAEITTGDAGIDQSEPESPQHDDGPAPATRRSRRSKRLALPALGLSLVLLAGCSADSWPKLPETPEPTESETVITPENHQPPAVTEAQARSILLRLAATIEQADQEGDLDLLRTRMTGAPFDERETEYLLQAAIEDRPLPAPIPTDNISILLPQAYSSWPRTVLLVADSETEMGKRTVILTMVQDDPWQHYRLVYLADMQPATKLPNLAPAWLGTQLIPPDSPFLAMLPEDLPGAFKDLVDLGRDSEYTGRFDEATLALVDQITASRATVTQRLEEHGSSSTSQVEFSMHTTDFATISLGTLDSGAIVAISVIDAERVTPTDPDAMITYSDNAEAKALTGAEESAKGVETTYSMQLFFSVPSTGSNEPIRLLAVHHKLLWVEALK